MQWQHHLFNQLDIDTLYDILKLRIDVFVVEQTCYYPDLDDKDREQGSLHVYGYENDQLLAYLRCLPPGCAYEDGPTIGRVIVAEQARGRHLGHELIKQGIQACQRAWPGHDIHMSAQEHLQKYYQQHDFITCTEVYLEDDIPHVDMIRKAQ